MTTILLIRHGETDWNAERRWQGHADPPLNDRGREQARELAERLSGRGLVAVWSSDLGRARETAEIVAGRLGLPVMLDARLREVDVGEWSGLTTTEIEERYPDGLARRRRGETGWVEGETMEAMEARVVEAVQAVAALAPDGEVAVVTHGGPISRAWNAAGGPRMEWTRAENCGVYPFSLDADGTLRRLPA